jgi:DNA methylase
VLDPFIGSDTTAVAAEQLGRDWLGIEITLDFAAMATTRIADAGIPRHQRKLTWRTTRSECAAMPVVSIGSWINHPIYSSTGSEPFSTPDESRR